MIYYIFGGNTESFVIKSKNAVMKTDDLRDAITRFHLLCDEGRYNYMYLICDFELTPNKFLRSNIRSIEESDDTLPYLHILEYDKARDTGNKKDRIRKDTIDLKMSGFCQEFNDNLVAMDKLIDCINDSVYATLELSYRFTYEDSDKEYIRRKSIGSTADLITISHHSKGFKITPITWKSNKSPSTPIPNFYIKGDIEHKIITDTDSVLLT